MRHIALVLLVAALPPHPAFAAGGHAASASAAGTGKERLSDKGSDEQRVDDCKVPQQRRTRIRPTDCHVQ
jgi:hypothetical protein